MSWKKDHHVHVPAEHGRKATEQLSQGCGSQQGHDTKGPTALLNSVALFEPRDSKHWCAPLFNVKLSPGSLHGEAGTRNLMAYLRTHCDRKIWHIQFNAEGGISDDVTIGEGGLDHRGQ